LYREQTKEDIDMANQKIQEIASRLLESQAAFEQTIASVPAGVFHRAPKEGEWSSAQVAAHVCESSVFLARNARRMATEDNPFIGRGPDAVAERDRLLAERGQDSQPEALRRVKEANAEALAIVSSLADQDLARTGQHPRMGEPTVEQILEMIIHHNTDHINQVKEAAGL
jgi:hypothetical protein